MNQQRGGQFEHTLIIVDEGAELHYIEGCSSPRYSQSSLHAGCVEIFVKAGAKMRYSSIENWSKNVYNLNTKRALVDQDATMIWVSGNMGSKTTMLYPCSILRGEGAFSGRPKAVLYTVVSRSEVVRLKNLILAIDPTAFITISEANEVMGEGFTLDDNRKPIAD